MIFLGRIIELLSGDDYEMYITKNILMPLGMHQTFFDRAPYHLRCTPVSQLLSRGRRRPRGQGSISNWHHRVERRFELAIRRHGEISVIPDR